MSQLRRCTAKARSGKRCRNRPIQGAKVCRMHGGSAPQVRNAAKRRLAVQEARNQLARLGVSLTVDPLEALLGQVYEAAGAVGFFRELVAELLPNVGGYSIDDDGTIHVEGTGIAGPDHLGDARPHILVTMYNQERDRLANMAKLCLDAGVAERRVALAEREGELLAKVIQGVLEDLKLTKGQRAKAPGIVRKRLSAVAESAA